MIDFNSIADFIGINPGWIGVLAGLTLFGMGWYKGKQVGVVHGADSMITMLELGKFIKVKRRFTDETGNTHTEYMRFDESE